MVPAALLTLAIALNVDAAASPAPRAPSDAELREQTLQVLDPSSKKQVRERPSPDEGFAKLFDARSLTVIREATRVEIIRLQGVKVPAYPEMDDYDTALAKRGQDAVLEFRVQRRVPAVSPELLAKLQTLATTKDAYEVYEGIKLCGGFQPKIVFRFWREVPREKADSVDLLVCFNCDDVAVVRAPSTRAHARAVAAFGDIEASRRTWLELARAALPDDALFQNLKP